MTPKLPLITVCLLATSSLSLAHPDPTDDAPSTLEAIYASDLGHVTISTNASSRIIECDGLPDHPTGRFPGPGNPNAISPQKYSFKMPLKPKPLDRPREVRGLLWGVALNGVPFDPGTAEFWHNDRSSGWMYEALSGKVPLGIDSSNAHVQPTGAYHYHGIPKALVARLAGKDEGKSMTLVGYAADGFPVYSQYGYVNPNDATSGVKILKSGYHVKPGTRPAGNEGPGGKYDGTFSADYEWSKETGDLDEANGRTGVTPEFPAGTYYYVLTEEFPHVPRMLKAEPDLSFHHQGGPPRPRNNNNNGEHRGPPHPLGG